MLSVDDTATLGTDDTAALGTDAAATLVPLVSPTIDATLGAEDGTDLIAWGGLCHSIFDGGERGQGGEGDT